LAPRRHLKTQAENGAHRALLATSAGVSLAAILLLTAISASLLSCAEVLHAGHRHARGQTPHEALHIALPGHSLLSAVAPLKHLGGIGKAHPAKTTPLLSGRRSDESALTPSEAAADGTVAENPGAPAAAAAHPTAGCGRTHPAAAKPTGLSKATALAATAGLAKATLAHAAAAGCSTKLRTTSSLCPQRSAAQRPGSQKHRRKS
jgi:hypothetical protein